MEQENEKTLPICKLSCAIFFLGVTAFIATLGILLFCLPQRNYSEAENRYLTTFQEISLSAFWDTSLQENITDGANDQFIGRDFWMCFATRLQRLAGFQDAGGVYFGTDGYYFERLLDTHIPFRHYTSNLQYIEQFASTYQNAKTTLLPVPSAGSILTDKLPAHAVLYNAGHLYTQADSLLQQASLLDIRNSLEEQSKSRQVYFRTDHHWTMDGAYTAYTAWCEAHHTTPTPLARFCPECVSETFYGTLHAKAPDRRIRPDYLTIPKQLPKASITIDTHKADSIYDWSKLESKDKYGVYFGGNFGRINIQTQESGKKLLVIKDSFANSLVPFLMGDFGQIIMLDLRYYNEPVSRLMQAEQPDEVLFLYEISNFAQDRNLFKILK